MVPGLLPTGVRHPAGFEAGDALEHEGAAQRLPKGLGACGHGFGRGAGVEARAADGAAVAGDGCHDDMRNRARVTGGCLDVRVQYRRSGVEEEQEEGGGVL